MAGHTINISVLADTKKFHSAMAGLGKATGLTKLGSVAKRTGIALAGTMAAGVTGGMALGKELITAGEAASTSNARILQVATSMKLFGSHTKEVADRLVEVAEKTALQTGVDANVIKLSQAKLLTFKNLAGSAKTMGGAFDRATKATVDMAAAGFGTADQNAVQLGKALNDPIKGITALNRSGITFTETEKKRIATLVKSNQVSKAQDVILKAVENQVGGTAAATANSSDQIKVAVDQVKEHFGQKLLPAFAKVSQWIISTGLPTFQEFADKAFAKIGPQIDKLIPKVQALIPHLVSIGQSIATTLVPALTSAGQFIVTTIIPAADRTARTLAQHKTALLSIVGTVTGFVAVIKAVKTAQMAANLTQTATLTILRMVRDGHVLATAAKMKDIAVMGAHKVATAASAAAQWALNAAMSANPIALVVIALTALVAGLIIAYRHSEKFRTVVNKAWSSIKSAAVAGARAFMGALRSVASWLSRTVSAVMNFGRRVGSSLSRTWSSARRVTSSGVSAVVGFIRGLPGRAASGLSSLGSRIGSAFSRAWSGARSRTSSGISSLLSVVRSLPGRIVGALSGIGSRMVSIGGQIISGMVQGVEGAAGRLASAARNAAGRAVDAIKGKLGIHSPSTVAYWIFEMFSQGGINALNDGARRMAATARDMADRVSVAARPDPLQLDWQAGSSQGQAAAPITINLSCLEPTAEVRRLLVRTIRDAHRQGVILT